MIADPIPAHSAFAGDQVGPAYNEAAFRYFLANDQVRAKRSRRFIYLVLVALQEHAGRPAELTHTLSAAVFGRLGTAIRDVDFVGWFREGRVAGAVLAQGPSASEMRAASAIRTRLHVELTSCLPSSQASRLRIRVFRLGTTGV